MPGVRINMPNPIDAIAAAANVPDHGDVATVTVPSTGDAERLKGETNHAGEILVPPKKNSK